MAEWVLHPGGWFDSVPIRRAQGRLFADSGPAQHERGGEVRSCWFGWEPGVAWARSDGWLLLDPGRGRRDGGGIRGRGGRGGSGRW